MGCMGWGPMGAENEPPRVDAGRPGPTRTVSAQRFYHQSGSIQRERPFTDRGMEPGSDDEEHEATEEQRMRNREALELIRAKARSNVIGWLSIGTGLQPLPRPPTSVENVIPAPLDRGGPDRTL